MDEYDEIKQKLWKHHHEVAEREVMDDMCLIYAEYTSEKELYRHYEVHDEAHEVIIYEVQQLHELMELTE